MATSGLSGQLSCPLCRKPFSDPVLLPCGHNFCRACIRREWTPEGAQGGQQQERCPTCQERCPGANFTPNRVLANLVETVRDSSGKMEIPEVPGGEPVCSEHREKIFLFCVQDMKECCLVCRDSMLHSGHRLYPVLEAAALMRAPIIAHNSHVTKTIAQVDGLVTEQVALIEAHKVEKMHLSGHITNEFDKLHKFLNDKEKRLQEKLNVQGRTILQEMEQNLERLKAQLTDLRQTMAKCEERIKEPDAIRMLQGLKDFNSRFCDKKQLKDKRAVVKKELSRGEFKGPMQYHTWKAMLSIIKPVPSPLKLDQNSAHVDLVFPDPFSLFYKKQLSLFRSQSPGRFTSFIMALTTEGFDEGKHYLEVDVGEKAVWFTGLAAENVNRTQTGHAAIRDGYWAICRWADTGLCVLDKPLRSLRGRIPTRVGIYLDYENGQVSFYDALSMVHLHSFKENFTGKLYFYLAPGGDDEVPMKIVRVQL